MRDPRLTTSEITDRLAGLPGWVLAADVLHARHEAPDVPTATRILSEVFAVAEEVDHHPDADLRWRRIRWRLTTHDSGGVTARDLDLAARISAVAAAAGASRLDAAPAVVSIGVDTADVERSAAFWEAALAYRRTVDDGGDVALEDPTGMGPTLWFQETDGPAPGRNRLHLDVHVSVAEAPARRAAIEAAGGRLVTDEFGPRWYVYADHDGNEVCVVPQHDPS